MKKKEKVDMEKLEKRKQELLSKIQKKCKFSNKEMENVDLLLKQLVVLNNETPIKTKTPDTKSG